jgi:hypothetical protein
LRREAISAHHRVSGETGTDAGAFNDPALSGRINLEAQACRTPHSAPWTGSSAVPPPDATALAAARAAASHQAPKKVATIPMPLALIVAEAVNAIMPMVDYLRQKQDQQHHPDIEHGIMLLQARLDRIEDAQSFFGIVLGLRRLAETVVSRRTHLTSEREILALESTIRRVGELKVDAERER